MLYRAAIWLVVIGLAVSSLFLGGAPRDPVARPAVPGQRRGHYLLIYSTSDPLTRGPVDDLLAKFNLFPAPFFGGGAGNLLAEPYAAFPAPGIAVIRTDAADHAPAQAMQQALARVASRDLSGPVYVDGDDGAAAIEAALERSVTLQASEWPLEKVLAEVQHAIGVRITAAWERLPVNPDRIVTFHGRASARTVLRCVLETDHSYDPIDYDGVGGAIVLVKQAANRRRLYPVQHLLEQGLMSDALLGMFRRPTGALAEQPWYEPAGAVVVADTPLGHEHFERRFRERAADWGQVRLTELVPPASLLDRSVQLARQRRSVPQFAEYLAQQTGSPVYASYHLHPADAEPLRIEGDGQGGTLREQLVRILTPVELGVAEDPDTIVITTL